ncbi:hypothetical protein HELRODRAFT_160966 [Helobdella robusta]|uniref:Uncharacterized protein n=1 Tax=Helobdella robusta TaxID=6412 RepID=T1EQX6_HELRO|nr:hypothetical protein HELRODRAFT_160966 [Helobdella robusta]ESO01799.1 hypothetical protein HELRODRAFT_160966 [Helobdella robusta]
MARSLVNNEVLYFLENNWCLSENDSFVNNIVKFYSFEDIDNAIKALKNELFSLKIEKIEKFQPRGNRKREKLFECIFIMKYLKENKYWEKCSIFVSSNLNKVPKVESLLTINFQIIEGELIEMLHNQQMQFNKLVEAVSIRKNNVVEINKFIEATENNNINTVKLEKLVDTVENKLVVDVHNADMNKNLEINATEELVNKPLWLDAYDSPIGNDVRPFLLVNKRKKSQQLSNNTKADNKPKLSTNKVADSKTVEKKPVRIIGQKILDNGKLKADKELIKKPVFCLSNISKCHRNDVEEYLTTNGIRLLSCYPVVKQFKKKSIASENSIDNNTVNYSDDKTKDDIESSMFRVCIDRNDVKKIKDPAILPQHIIVREWQFNKKAQVTVEKTKKDG